MKKIFDKKNLPYIIGGVGLALMLFGGQIPGPLAQISALSTPLIITAAVLISVNRRANKQIAGTAYLPTSEKLEVARRTNKRLMIIGPSLLAGSGLLTFSPLLIASATTPAGGNMWSEGGGGGGGAIWLMFLTVPLGLAIFAGGLAVTITAIVRHTTTPKA